MSLRDRLAVFPVVAGLVLAGSMFSGCSVVKKEDPVERAAQACCKDADPKLQHFAGCRIPRRSCRKEERWWMRGHVTCGAVDEANCMGGRCCEYKPMYDPSVGQPPAEAAADAPPAAAEEPAEDAGPESDAADAAAPDAATEDAADAAPEADGDDPEAPLP